MGMFSWIYSDTNRQMLDGVAHDSFLLVPPEFKKEFGDYHIKETCYEGYGIMGKYDIYDLVAYWNKEWILENADTVMYSSKTVIKDFDWFDIIKELKDVNNFEEFKKAFVEKYESVDIRRYRFCELRTVGIDIACYDEDNESLENPIKIVESGNLTYNQASPSISDPNQGWWVDDYDYDEEEDY